MTLSAAEQNVLARAIQQEVPLVPQPWDEIGRRVALDPRDILAQLQVWKDEGKLREISAVLEGSLLGYESALCTAAVPADRIRAAAEAVNAHPTVSHNYMRDHAYNLWFTVAVPRTMGLDGTLQRLAARAGLRAIQPLRRTQTFKIAVNLDLFAQKNVSENEFAPSSCDAPFDPTPEEIRLFRALQIPLPLSEKPFLDLARAAGADEAEILAFGRKYLGGAIRRYVATFRHRRVGVQGNVLVVWNVAEKRLQEAGSQLAGAPEVSHCYGREPFQEFPYRLYTMIHGPDEASCLGLAAELSSKIGVTDYLPLPSRQEFKKCRLRYFLPELDEWWAGFSAQPQETAQPSTEEGAA